MSETALGAVRCGPRRAFARTPLVRDPYAAAFVAAAPPLFPDVPSHANRAELAALVEASVAAVAVRTRFFDDYLLAACASGCRQVVLLGAGLDARAFRLDWPDGVHVFEVDLPGLFGFKERVLTEQGATARCRRHLVPVDLRDDWPARLLAGSFDRSVLSAWVAEGVLIYLSNEDAEQLLTAVGGLACCGSHLAFDYDSSTSDSGLNDSGDVDGMQAVTSLWKGGIVAPEVWLRNHSWQAHTVAAITPASRLGREVSGGDGTLFVAAVRRR